MSAEVLHRAASRMRERAEAATPGPWEVLWNAIAYVDTVADPSDRTGQTPMQQLEKVADAASRDRDHIAGMHPAVALAVADWLDFVAAGREVLDALDRTRAWLSANGTHQHLPEGPRPPSQLFLDNEARALAVARAYLGPDA